MLKKMRGILRQWVFDPKPNLFSKFFAETSACAIFHFIGSISPTPWANGIALMVLVYYTAKTSGAHLNPALTLTFTLLGHTNPIELLVYWIAQTFGTILGALWIALLVPGMSIGEPCNENKQCIYDGCFYPGIEMSHARVFGWEAFGTFCFILPIFSVVWYTLHKEGYGNTGPLMVGLSLIANALAVGPFTGAAFNPARVFASPVVFKCDNSYMLYYILGEFTGAAIVPLIIAPWYGISPTAWYLNKVPEKAKVFLEKAAKKKHRSYQDSLDAYVEINMSRNGELIKTSPNDTNSMKLPQVMMLPSPNFPPQLQRNFQNTFPSRSRFNPDSPDRDSHENLNDRPSQDMFSKSSHVNV